MKRTHHTPHDTLARIVALLLGLAMLAERTTSRPRAVRLLLLPILLPARHAVLNLMDVPPENDDFSERPALDEIGTLLLLAVTFRAMAALFMHACLTEGRPAADTPSYAIVLSSGCGARAIQRRDPEVAGRAHDTS